MILIILIIQIILIIRIIPIIQLSQCAHLISNDPGEQMSESVKCQRFYTQPPDYPEYPDYPDYLDYPNEVRREEMCLLELSQANERQLVPQLPLLYAYANEGNDDRKLLKITITSITTRIQGQR